MSPDPHLFATLARQHRITRTRTVGSLRPVYDVRPRLATVKEPKP